MPGAVHTRFEHSIGAMHVADKMIQYVNMNCYTNAGKSFVDKKFIPRSIEKPVRLFIRLGALLHDIGHVPFGHTLEDELEHLEKHDSESRIRLVAEERHYDGYKIDQALGLGVKDAGRGWTLQGLVDQLYNNRAHALTTEAQGGVISAFEIVKLITLKPPPAEKDLTAHNLWNERKNKLAQVFPVSLCRDIIGNTICADFLDYLHRDWYHMGKPIQEDRRLYAYMEARVPEPDKDKPDAQQFVINVGPDQKLRHELQMGV